MKQYIDVRHDMLHDDAEAINQTSFEILINIHSTQIPASISVLVLLKFKGQELKSIRNLWRNSCHLNSQATF